MATTLINEKEFVDKYAQTAAELNLKLQSSLDRKYAEMGLNPNLYIGGLECVSWTSGQPLESCIKNLFAAYANNFQNSIFFQADTSKKLDALMFIQQYLTERDLLNDYLSYKEEKSNH